MIPLDTPPGAEVICIDASSPRSSECPTEIVLGAVYTVRSWTTEMMTGKSLVDLHENYHEEWAWNPADFRLLDLGGLDACLNSRVKESA